ncbi:5-formyltetrahydrofolate cyclo-ligase [Gulosibacter chungangensis]|nr:5-formyltetrahydrofolate cyclo-ligase [Gulosibacter chungangensis]
MLETVIAEKKRLRARVRELRARRKAADIAALAAPVADALLALVHEHRARRVACFLSSPVEVPTRDFLQRARDHEIEVLLPVAKPEGRLKWVLDTGAERQHPLLRVPEPVGPTEPGDALATAELIIVPAALVDRQGYRLGWGGGFYDRALVGRTVPVFALVHEDEVVDAVPRELHDRPVDGIVTPKGQFQVESAQ